MKEQPKHIQKMIDIIESDNEFTMFIDSLECCEVDMEDEEFCAINGDRVPFSDITEDSMDSIVVFYDIEELEFEDDIVEFSKDVKKAIKNVDKNKNKFMYSVDGQFLVTEESLEELLSITYISENIATILFNYAEMKKFDKIKV